MGRGRIGRHHLAPSTKANASPNQRVAWAWQTSSGAQNVCTVIRGDFQSFSHVSHFNAREDHGNN